MTDLVERVVNAMSECGIGGELYTDSDYEEAARAAIKIVRAAERERCARVAESFADEHVPEWLSYSHQIAAAIRARKDD